MESLSDFDSIAKAEAALKQQLVELEAKKAAESAKLAKIQLEADAEAESDATCNRDNQHLMRKFMKIRDPLVVHILCEFSFLVLHP